MKKIFTKQSLSVVLCLLLCAAFTAIYFQEEISNKIYNGMDTKTIKITTGVEVGYDYSELAPICISGSSAFRGANQFSSRNDQSFEELKAAVIENNGFVEFIEPITKEKCFKSTIPSSTIVFKMTFAPETAFTLSTGQGFGQAYVYPEDEEAYNTYFNIDSKPSNELVFPFRTQQGAYHYLRYMVAYLLIILVVFALYYCLYLLVLKFNNSKQKFMVKIKQHSKINRKAMFVLLCVCCFAFFAIQYYVEPKNFYFGNNIMSDAYYYAYGPFFDESGQFSITYFLQHALLHRGVYQSFVYLIFGILGSALHIEMMYFHFAMIAIIFAATFAYFVPMFYKAIFEKETNNFAIIIAAAIFLAFWHTTMRYPLSDTIGCLFMFGAIAFFSRGMQDKKKRSFAWSGALMSLGLNWRASYSLVYYSVLGIMAVVLCTEIYKYFTAKDKQSIKTAQIKQNIRNTLLYILIFVAMVAAVKLPQQILLLLGGISPFTSTNIVWSADYINHIENSIVEANLQNSYTLYSNFSTQYLDKQMSQIYGSIYGYNTNLQFKDIIYLWMNKPFDSFIMTLKRVIWSLQVSNSLAYGGNTSPLFSKIILLINSSMYITLGYSLFSRKLRKALYNNKYITFLLLAFVTTGLSQAVLAIETRYFMFVNLVVIITFVVILLQGIAKNEEIKKEIYSPRFLVCLNAANLCVFAFYRTVQMNFK
ncbi:MAG: hypothetical protein RR508_06505 [Oscillospiraceae bacterium]